jgi:hypothetical protein
MEVPPLISLTIWTPFLYAIYPVPGSSLWVGEPAPAPFPHIAGITLYPNVGIAVVFLLLTRADTN